MIIAGAVLAIGFLMTYLSRLPLAFERGADWIWSYIPAGDAQAWILFNLFHAASLAPLVLFGFFYVYGKIRWTFHFAAIAHFITTFFLYYRYEARRAEDVLNFVLFPVIIAGVSLTAGIIDYFLERKTASAS
jgi:nitrate reductase NapE component